MFNVALDFSDLDVFEELAPAVDKAVKEAQRNLAAIAMNHIQEEVKAKLHSRRRMYLDALTMYEDQGDIVVSLDASVRWIEDGLKPHSMLDDLLASPKAKTTKDGTGKYLVVPFEHNKTKQDQTPAQRTLLDTIRKSLRQVGVSVNGIETNAQGEAKTGLVRKLDILGSPLKHINAPGMGHGQIGDVRQGPTGIPFLQGVRVYQNKYTKKGGEEGIKRSIVTFRVASTKQKDKGRWDHPGLEAKNFFEEAARWAQEMFDKEIGPQIMQHIEMQLSG